MKAGLPATLGLLACSALAACGAADNTLGPNDVADAGGDGLGLSCPPDAAEFGLELGDVVPDVELVDCDGTPVSLHELCNHKAAYFFVYTDW